MSSSRRDGHSSTTSAPITGSDTRLFPIVVPRSERALGPRPASAAAASASARVVRGPRGASTASERRKTSARFAPSQAAEREAEDARRELRHPRVEERVERGVDVGVPADARQVAFEPAVEEGVAVVVVVREQVEVEVLPELKRNAAREQQRQRDAPASAGQTADPGPLAAPRRLRCGLRRRSLAGDPSIWDRYRSRRPRDGVSSDPSIRAVIAAGREPMKDEDRHRVTVIIAAKRGGNARTSSKG